MTPEERIEELERLLRNLAQEVRKEEAFQRRLGRFMLHEDTFAEAILEAEAALWVPTFPTPARADGSLCRDCGGMTVQTGACRTCTECGTTGGCG